MRTWIEKYFEKNKLSINKHTVTVFLLSGNAKWVPAERNGDQKCLLGDLQGLKFLGYFKNLSITFCFLSIKLTMSYKRSK